MGESFGQLKTVENSSIWDTTLLVLKMKIMHMTIDINYIRYQDNCLMIDRDGIILALRGGRESLLLLSTTALIFLNGWLHPITL